MKEKTKKTRTVKAFAVRAIGRKNPFVAYVSFPKKGMQDCWATQDGYEIIPVEIIYKL